MQRFMQPEVPSSDHTSDTSDHVSTAPGGVLRQGITFSLKASTELCVCYIHFTDQMRNHDKIK